MMKNRMLTVVLSVLFGAMSILAQVEFDVVNGAGTPIRYKVISETEKTVAVTGGRKFYDKVKELIIPETVNYNGTTYRVTEIDEFGLSSKWRGSKNLYLEKVVLPSSIVKIGLGAFSECLELTSINLPEGLVEIEGLAFYRTPKLTKLYIPNSVRRIDNAAFLWGMNVRSNAFIENLPLFVTTENCEKMGISKQSVETYLTYHPRTTSPAVQPQQQIVQAPPQQLGQQEDASVVKQPKAPSSDVDIDIPTNPATNENTFAFIFANEDYHDMPKVEYALNDGEMFKEYCHKVLGLPTENVILRENATLNHIKAEISLMQKLSNAHHGEIRFIVYYAGHGIPDEESGNSYLMPVDGTATMVETGYSLRQLYKELGEMASQGVTVFLDACFSGTNRGEGMLASARGVAIKAKPQAPQGKVVVFSAAQGDETAHPYKDKEHGMFTYFLLKKLKETRGDVSLGELGTYVSEQVTRKSLAVNHKEQTPCVQTSGTIGEVWRNLRLK